MKKYFKYLHYILKHKYYVLIECCKLGIPFRGVIHDLSKFLPDEFIPYMWNFYGPWKHKERPNWVINKFNLAWLKHQKRNKHHWQYWIVIQDDDTAIKLLMPDKYCKEMLADWKGASRAICKKDNTLDWYIQRQNRMKKVLHPETRKWIENELFISYFLNTKIKKGI